jgi:N-acyl-D-aspartate/D-glutamate deacylase
MRSRLADPSARDRALTEFRTGWFGGIPWFWDRVLLSKVDGPDSWCVGLTIEEASARAGMDPAEWALQLCLDHGNAARVVLFYRTEDDMTTFLAHPLSIVGSDGSAIPFDTRGEQPHPRSFGTYPRVLGRYAREHRTLPLEEAVRKCTWAAAERLQIRDRGLLQVGMAGDVVVFDPDSIVDAATFTHPALPAVGVHHVMVNGELVVSGGHQTDARPGRVLRRVGPSDVR